MIGYLRHLANFARIVEAGSMKSASETLGVAASGLSDSVKILENRFGTALLIRHKAGVTPTTEGERVYASAAGIVDLLNDVMGEDPKDDLVGTCRLSVPTEIARFCLGPYVKYLGEQYPKLGLKVYAEDDLVDHSRFARDYFIRIAPTLDQSKDLRTLWTGTANAILVAPAHLVPTDASDKTECLAHLTAITNTTSPTPFVYKLAKPNGHLKLAKTIGVSHPAARLDFAVQGLGMAGCLDICAASFLKTGVLTHVLPNRFRIPLEVRLMTPHRRKMRFDNALTAAMACLYQTTDPQSERHGPDDSSAADLV